MKNVLMLLFVLVLLSALPGCRKQQNTAQADTKSKYTCSMHPQIVEEKPGTFPICGMELVQLKHSGNSMEIMLTDTQIKLANISTTMVRVEDFGNTRILTGRLAMNEEQTELISSRVSGRIEKLQIREVGQPISRGQELYKIYSEDLLALEREYLLALEQEQVLGKERNQYSSFVQSAQKKLELKGLSQAQVSALANKGEVQAQIVFLSPVQGVVTEVNVTEGQYVSEGTTLYRVARLEKIWVEAELYPNEMSLVKVGDNIEVVVQGFNGKKITGKVTFLSPEYRAGTQITTLRAEIENVEGKLLPGMQASVILSHSLKKTIALPVDAVIRNEQGSHVWILTPEGAYSSRKVQTGTENGEKIEIISGLDERENVVITGAYLLYGEFILKKGADPMALHTH